MTDRIDRRTLMKKGVAGLGAAFVGAGSSAGRAGAAEGSPRDAGAAEDSRGGAGGAEGVPGRAGAAEGSPVRAGAVEQRYMPAPSGPFAAAPIELVRIGFVGVGGMGTNHVGNLLALEGCEIRAVCDIRPEHAQRAARMCVEAGAPEPTLYTRGERDFVRMCETEELDLVFTATPWRWHVPVCVAAMENGKHAATEVPAAVTLEECWQLVETAEQHEKHCLMMENCNYGRSELMVLNMVRQGVLGEILHAECGYLHDLRSIKFADEGEGLWRRDHSISRNGNLYPTHGLGPVANCMDVNRGDRFDTLVSMSSPSRGLQLHAEENFPPGDPKRREEYSLGDVNASLIRTARGRTIYLVHDTNLPRPYSRIHKVQGTRGLFHGYPDRLYVEGMGLPHRWIDAEGHETPDGERWDLERVRAEYGHPLWRQLQERAREGGHGGMDFIEDYRLIRCLNDGEPTDMNVYDAAALSAVSELSEISVARGGEPVEFPDFTRGRWRGWPPLGIVEA